MVASVVAVASAAATPAMAEPASAMEPLPTYSRAFATSAMEDAGIAQSV
jgi:hypothetical protein